VRQRESRQPGQLAANPHMSAGTPQSSASVALRGRRATSWRLPVLEHSGRSEPWWYPPPTSGYDAAVAHLRGVGLLPGVDREGLRALWRRGGDSRRAAEQIARAWQLELEVTP
jgi:hypothetical protein